jgi:hypothetical protein
MKNGRLKKKKRGSTEEKKKFRKIRAKESKNKINWSLKKKKCR